MTSGLVIRQEITEWAEPATPNHIYIFRNKKLIGYVPQGSKDAFYFSRPSVHWSPSKRKFKYLSKKEIAELNI